MKKLDVSVDDIKKALDNPKKATDEEAYQMMKKIVERINDEEN